MVIVGQICRQSHVLRHTGKVDVCVYASAVRLDEILECVEKTLVIAVKSIIIHGL